MRNPGNPQRRIKANERKTSERIEQYNGIVDLRRTWEAQPKNVQADNHAYIIHLRARERNIRNLLLHRADARIKM